jgi:hypothetical protein
MAIARRKRNDDACDISCSATATYCALGCRLNLMEKINQLYRD